MRLVAACMQHRARARARTDDKDARVALHLLVERGVDGVADGHLKAGVGRGGERGVSTIARAVAERAPAPGP